MQRMWPGWDPGSGWVPNILLVCWVTLGKFINLSEAQLLQLVNSLVIIRLLQRLMVFPGGSEVKASACNAGDLGSIPGSGRSPGEGNGNPLQYSCLENPMDRGAWWATVHGVTKSWTRLSNFSLNVLTHMPALWVWTWVRLSLWC